MGTVTATVTKHSMSKLEELFTTFNQVSVDLGSRYQELEARVAALNTELAVSHLARRQELTAKEQLAAKLSSLVDTLPGGVIVLDAKGTVREANAIALRMLGANIVNQNWSQSLRASSGKLEMSGGELTLHNGMRICISSNVYGSLGEQVVLLTDVSENFRLRNLINREERLAALGEMSARLAHQVRTPLSTAILYLSHLPVSMAGEQNGSIIKKIHDRLRQIESLTDSMLCYMRGETRTQKIFSLNAVLKEVREASILQLRQRGGDLRLNTPITDCLIEGDKEAIFNALGNLVENSMLAVATAPLITISLWREAANYCLIVEDNGPGIEVAIREKIFDPFYSGRPGGTGLGLAVVMSAVRACSGQITVKTAKTGGALIEIKLPVNLKVTGSECSIWNTDSKSSIEHKVYGELAYGQD